MPEAAQKPSRGCFFYGCLTMILITIGVLVGLYFGTRQAVHLAIGRYTATGPAPIPALALSPAEQRALAESLQARAEAATSGRESAPFLLGETELNVLLGQSAKLASFRDQIYLRPASNRLEAHLSLPLDQFQPWKEMLAKLRSRKFAGRYFNGVATLDLAITNGAVNVSIQDLIVNQSRLPDEFTARVRGRNLIPDGGQLSQAPSLVQKIASLTVTNDQVLVEFAR